MRNYVRLVRSAPGYAVVMWACILGISMIISACIIADGTNLRAPGHLLGLSAWSVRRQFAAQATTDLNNYESPLINKGDRLRDVKVTDVRFSTNGDRVLVVFEVRSTSWDTFTSCDLRADGLGRFRDDGETRFHNVIVVQ